MATAIDAYAPFDSGSGSNVLESTWRDMMRHVLPSGVIWGEGNNFEVFADSTGMQVKVKSGACWIRGHWGRNDTQRTLTIGTSHATLTRIDTVVLRADFVNNVIQLDVLAGTPSGSPVAPSLTQTTSVWEIRIGDITVTNAVVTIAANKVDRNNAPYTSGIPSGGPMYVEAEYNASSVQSIPSGTDTVLAFGTDNRVTPYLTKGTDGPGHNFTVVRPGLWRVTNTCRWSAAVDGAERYNAIQVNGAPRASQNSVGSNSIKVTNNISVEVNMNIGDIFRVIGFQSSGSNKDTETNNLAGWMRVNFAWLHA